MERPNHKHILLCASFLKKPPTTIDQVQDWLLRLVEKVNMQVLMGPFVTYCADPGNEGITGVVVIKTSHCSVHFWENNGKPYVQMDLYSCADFDVNDVFQFINEFEPGLAIGVLVDRNGYMTKDNITNKIMFINEGRVYKV